MLGGASVVVVRSTSTGGIVNGVQTTDGLHGFRVVVVDGGFVGTVRHV